MHTFAEKSEAAERTKSAESLVHGSLFGHSHAANSIPHIQRTTDPGALLHRISSFGHDFSQIPVHGVQRMCACGGGCPHCQQENFLQTKLQIGQPGDALEREADRAAERVLRMPQAELAEDRAAFGDNGFGRVPHVSPTNITAPPLVDQALRSPGEALDPKTRRFMEAGFGYDFSGVRVHSGAAAEESARELNALAYTVGRDIVLGGGRLESGTIEGRRLMAHELAHVVQQGRAQEITPGLETRPTSARVLHPALQRQPANVQQSQQAGWIKDDYSQKVLDSYIWPAAMGSVSGVQQPAVGKEVWDALIGAGAQITILFVAERGEIPAGSAAESVLGYCDPLGGGVFTVYVLAGKEEPYWVNNPSGSRTLMSRTVARSQDEIAETLFHELLHAWFQTMFPKAAIPTGHTQTATPIGDPKFDPKGYDPKFLERLQRFTQQQQKLIQARQSKKSGTGQKSP
jgi:uncharacterized protein DUF4157